MADTEYVLVAQYFHPDTAATGQLMTDLAVGLDDRGLDMTVYTTQPNYHSGDFESQPRREMYEGVDVRRIRAPQFKQTSLLRRAFNWTIFTIWMSLVLLVSRSENEREVVFVSNPPFFPLAMWLVCRLRWLPYTYIVHDLWPEKGVEFGFWKEGGVIDRVWSAFHKRVFRDANAVITLGLRMREEILDYDSSEDFAERVCVIHNWADEEFIQPMAKADNWFSKKHGLVDGFTLLYSGNLGLFHDVETAIRGVATFDKDMNLLIIGEGDARDQLKDVADSLNVRGNRVQFLPYQPREDLPYSLTCADISVVAVGEGFEGTCVSSKLYTALATGQPVLVIASADSDEATIVTEHDAGKQVAQGDYEGIAITLEEWLKNPESIERQGKNARNLFEERFTKDHAVDEYFRVLENNPSKLDGKESVGEKNPARAGTSSPGEGPA
jgi:glycosyltransferase involved in cell wall biosynthesis